MGISKRTGGGMRSSPATSQFPRLHLLAVLLLASLSTISESQKNGKSQSRFKLRKCSDRNGKCVEVPKDLIFELYQTINNLKNAFNNPLKVGRKARTITVNNN